MESEKIIFRSPSSLTPHPAIEQIQKVLGKYESKQDDTDLVESITKSGVLEPAIITPDGEVICGWRRVLACKEINIDVPCRETAEGISDERVVKWCVDENLKRRHLTPEQKIELIKTYKSALDSLSKNCKTRYKRISNVNNTLKDILLDQSVPLEVIEDIGTLMPQVQHIILNCLKENPNGVREITRNTKKVLGKDNDEIANLQAEIDALKSKCKSKEQEIESRKREIESLENKMCHEEDKVLKYVGTATEREELLQKNIEFLNTQIRNLEKDRDAARNKQTEKEKQLSRDLTEAQSKIFSLQKITRKEIEFYITQAHKFLKEVESEIEKMPNESIISMAKFLLIELGNIKSESHHIMEYIDKLSKKQAA